jgi:hypothetical protein
LGDPSHAVARTILAQSGGASSAGIHPQQENLKMNAAASPNFIDPHVQLRRLYVSLLEDQNRFDEFKQLLASYPAVAEDSDEESEEAERVRATLNARINDWVCGGFEGLSAAQVVLWRSIVVDERINVAISPWKESNFY